MGPAAVAMLELAVPWKCEAAVDTVAATMTRASTTARQGARRHTVLVDVINLINPRGSPRLEGQWPPAANPGMPRETGGGRSTRGPAASRPARGASWTGDGRSPAGCGAHVGQRAWRRGGRSHPAPS